MTRIKNIGKGPRFFHLDHGEPNDRGQGGLPGRVINLDPGQEWEGEVPDATLKQMKRRNDNLRQTKQPLDWSIDGSEDKAPSNVGKDEFDNMNDQQLRDFIAERDGKAPPGNTLRETLLAKARGEE
jgi:hypothetical protein